MYTVEKWGGPWMVNYKLGVCWLMTNTHMRLAPEEKKEWQLKDHQFIEIDLTDQRLTGFKFHP